MTSPTAAIVLDTNFVVSNIQIIEELNDLASTFGHVIIVPYQVLQELDKLKSSARSDLGFQARKGANWLYKQLAENNRYIVGQSLNDNIEPGLKGDDAILDCCRFYHERHNAFTVILSNDKILCAKALVHGVKTVTYVEGSTTAKQIAEMVNHYANEGDIYIPDIDDAMDYGDTPVRAETGTLMNDNNDRRSRQISKNSDERLIRIKSSLKSELKNVQENDPPSVAETSSKSKKSMLTSMHDSPSNESQLKQKSRKRKLTLEDLNESLGLHRKADLIQKGPQNQSYQIQNRKADPPSLPASKLKSIGPSSKRIITEIQSQHESSNTSVPERKILKAESLKSRTSILPNNRTN